MITADQFSPQFDKLCAAFAISKPEKIKDLWFEEFEECDYFTFCRAIKLLQRGDRFPNWGMLWDTYKPILPLNLQVQTRKGCNDCRNGKVFYVDYVLAKADAPRSGVMVYSLIGNCAACSKGVIKGCGDVYRKDMVVHENGEYWTQRAIDKLPEELKKVEEANKIRRLIWKKERFGRRRSTQE